MLIIRHKNVNIRVSTIPVFCRTMFAVASPYPPTQVTASASFSQDFAVSVLSHWDIVSIMHSLALLWFALTVFESKWSINCRPSCAQSSSANWAICRIFRTFLSSSCKAVKPVWKQKKEGSTLDLFQATFAGKNHIARLKSVQNHRTLILRQDNIESQISKPYACRQMNR